MTSTATYEQIRAANERSLAIGQAATARAHSRKIQRLIDQGWTVDAAVAHVDNACDQMLCTGEHSIG